MRTVFLFLVACAACGVPPAEERARREALAAEGQALDRAADTVEARLLAGEARLAVWHELAARHQQISEVSCRVADAHLEDMARLFEEQAEKDRGMRRKRALANAAEPPDGIGGPRVPIADTR